MKQKKQMVIGVAALTLAAVGVLIVVSARSGFLFAQDRSTPSRPAEAGLQEDRRVPVTVVETKRRDFSEYGEYFGEARGVSQATLTTDAGGRVGAIHVDEGDYVEAGASLAEIDRERVETRYSTAVLAEKLAREHHERERRFLEEGNTFQLKVDQAHLEWLQARSNLQDAQRLREGALAVTPISGTVTARHVDLNEDLDPGHVTFHVADLSRMSVSVGVPEADIFGVRELRRAEVQFSESRDATFDGVPVRFSRRRSDRSLTYRVDIEFDNPRELILAGQTARVRLELRRHEDVVVVPNRALYTRNNRAYVMVVDDGVARELPVRTGPSDASGTVILEGLSEGRLLVAEGFNRLADGALVRIVP